MNVPVTFVNYTTIWAEDILLTDPDENQPQAQDALLEVDKKEPNIFFERLCPINSHNYNRLPILKHKRAKDD